MFQQFILAVQQNTQAANEKTKLITIFAHATKNGFITALHRLPMILGLSAISILTVMFIRPDLAEKFINLSPFAVIEQTVNAEYPLPPSLTMLMATPQQIAQSADLETANTVATEQNQALGNERQQKWVTTWLARRYRVASDASNMLVSAAYLTAKEIKLDPLLILSVMAIESGLNPFAESPVGAQGLMQVMSKIHHEKFEEMGGIKAALNPVANIKVGALILKDYVTRGGSVEAGLKLYVGAAAFDNDAGYGSRVMAEYRRLKDVATGKNVSIFATSPPAPILVLPQEAPRIKLDTVNQTKDISAENKLPDQIARL